MASGAAAPARFAAGPDYLRGQAGRGLVFRHLEELLMDGQKRDVARRYPNLSRRGFLGIAGAAGSAAALGMPAAWAAGAGTERRSTGRASPLAAQGTRGDVGATV